MHVIFSRRLSNVRLIGAILFFSSLLLPGLIPTAHAQELEGIYWTSVRGVFKASSVDLIPEEIIPVTVRRPVSVVVDSVSGKVYWTDRGLGKIRRSNLDGSAIEDLVTEGTTILGGIDLDLDQAKMYWTDLGAHAIYRSNLDGNAIETLIQVDSLYPNDITLDLEGGKFYWIADHKGYVFSSNLDGSDTKMIVGSGPDKLESITLDAVNKKLYWSDWGINRIQRSNFDGTDIETFLSSANGLNRPSDLYVDAGQNKLYWNELGKHAIFRANLDRSNVEEVVRTGDPYRLTIDPVQQKLYWFDTDTNRLLRSDLNGNNQEPLIGTEAVFPEALALDLNNQQLLWRDTRLSTVQTVRFDGSEKGAFSAIGPFNFFFSMAVDNKQGKVYWNTLFPEGIQRANLDGSMVETVVSLDTLSISEVALDVTREHIYWVAYGQTSDFTQTFSIHRSNLDGSQQQVIIPDGILARPTSLAIHPRLQKIYWTDGGTNKIQSADLNGGNIEDIVVSGLDYPSSIAVDPAANKIYWAHFSEDKIQRANLDGSEVEDVMDVFRPFEIALKFPLTIANSTEDELISRPETFSVSGVYPNPFSRTARIEYTLSRPGNIQIAVFDVLGREVATLDSGAKQQGIHEIMWDGADHHGRSVPAGVYLVRIILDSGNEKVISLVKGK